MPAKQKTVDYTCQAEHIQFVKTIRMGRMEKRGQSWLLNLTSVSNKRTRGSRTERQRTDPEEKSGEEDRRKGCEGLQENRSGARTVPASPADENGRRNNTLLNLSLCIQATDF